MTKPWRKVRDKKLSEKQKQEVDRWVKRELMNMDLRGVCEKLPGAWAEPQ